MLPARSRLRSGRARRHPAHRRLATLRLVFRTRQSERLSWEFSGLLWLAQPSSFSIRTSPSEADPFQRSDDDALPGCCQVMYYTVYNRMPLSRGGIEQPQQLCGDRLGLGGGGRVLREHHQSGIRRDHSAGRCSRVEIVGEFARTLCQSRGDHRFEIAIEADGASGNLGVVERAIGQRVDGETAPGAAAARAQGDIVGEARRDRLARGYALRQLRFGALEQKAVIAIQRLAKQCVLVTERRIEAGFGQAAHCCDVIERRAVKALAPEHLKRGIKHGVGIEGAGTGHGSYIAWFWKKGRG